MKKVIKLDKVDLFNATTSKKEADLIELNCTKMGGGITFNCPDLDLENYNYLTFKILNKVDWMLGVSVKIWTTEDSNGEADKSVDMRVFPGMNTQLSVPLSVIDSNTLFLDRTPGRFNTIIMGKRVDINEVKAISIVT